MIVRKIGPHDHTVIFRHKGVEVKRFVMEAGVNYCLPLAWAKMIKGRAPDDDNLPFAADLRDFVIDDGEETPLQEVAGHLRNIERAFAFLRETLRNQGRMLDTPTLSDKLHEADAWIATLSRAPVVRLVTAHQLAQVLMLLIDLRDDLAGRLNAEVQNGLNDAADNLRKEFKDEESEQKRRFVHNMIMKKVREKEKNRQAVILKGIVRTEFVKADPPLALNKKLLESKVESMRVTILNERRKRCNNSRKPAKPLHP
jgi:hypothetical protein